ncbi:MAG: tRNA pseudouridine(55) synthase TruB [Micrococcales bacterium]|nr:MAG: tRNA pseudouridine(55) synthase TruB [Micrococcales bacterium]PIE27113.1 MAG: tRNA pseudouridine(55) synthase TruB [Micrococcales bacterium]
MPAADRQHSPVADGILVVDKPAGWTSHDVVARVRRLAGTRKVGHAGTLDPMATGVLILGLNRATRLLTYMFGADKEYLATIRLGAATSTDDADGEPVIDPRLGGGDASALTAGNVLAGVAALTGAIQQVPSSVSAVKVAGERAHDRVRSGQDVQLPARAVIVREFVILDQRHVDGFLDLDVRVGCSSGTYVRALARDLGRALRDPGGRAVGGHLTALRRTRVGAIGLAQASRLDTLIEQVERGGALPLRSMADAASAFVPVRHVSEQEVLDLRHGRMLQPTGRAGAVAAVGPAGQLCAILRDDRKRGSQVAAPQIVLAQ